MNIVETERLILRTWTDEDIEQYFQINQDPRVSEFLPSGLTIQDCKSFIQEQNRHFDEHGYTLFAAALKESANLIGFIGMKYTDWQSPFTPAVEIGWRLGSQYWGKGYATEAAKAVLDYAFNKCGLKEIVSFTVPANVRSIRVMERIGLKRDLNGDFAHPKLPLNHPLSKHVLYRISKL